MPALFPREFREDVVRVARNRDHGQTLQQSAADFGESEFCLTNWLAVADHEDGIRPGSTAGVLAELREGDERIRRLERENEILHRAAADLSQANVPGT